MMELLQLTRSTFKGCDFVQLSLTIEAHCMKVLLIRLFVLVLFANVAASSYPSNPALHLDGLDAPQYAEYEN